jgi:hypothetical protein
MIVILRTFIKNHWIYFNKQMYAKHFTHHIPDMFVCTQHTYVTCIIICKTLKDGTRPALFQNFCVVLCIVGFVSSCVLLVYKCVMYYCHRVASQLQLTNISYHITSYIISYITFASNFKLTTKLLTKNIYCF